MPEGKPKVRAYYHKNTFIETLFHQQDMYHLQKIKGSTTK